MTIDLKYTLPFIAPFVMMALIEAVWFAAGATITEPSILAYFNLCLGVLFGGLAVATMSDKGITWTVRIGRGGKK